MRRKVFVLLALVGAAQSANGQPAESVDPYPVEGTDRPLVLPAGATRFGVSGGFRTEVQDVMDSMGNTTQERTGFADDFSLQLSVAHAFGPVEVGVGVGRRACQRV